MSEVINMGEYRKSRFSRIMAFPKKVVDKIVAVVKDMKSYPKRIKTWCKTDSGLTNLQALAPVAVWSMMAGLSLGVLTSMIGNYRRALKLTVRLTQWLTAFSEFMMNNPEIQAQWTEFVAAKRAS